MTGELYSPLYLVHPETERLCKGKINIEFDPIVASSEMRSYKEQFLDKRPQGNNTPVTSKITSVYRMRSRDRRLEHLMWTERQSFTDALGNEVTFSRNYCGMYKIPQFKTTTVPDGQGGTKLKHDLKNWITLFDVPFNEDNARKIKELAEDPYTLQTYIQTVDDEEVFVISPIDFDKWAQWEFDALIEYCRFPQRFRGNPNLENEKAISGIPKNPPEMTKNELFSPPAEVTATKSKKK